MQHEVSKDALRVKEILDVMGVEIRLGQAQQLVARMGGFRSYQAARKAKVTPALLDLMMSALDRMADGESFNDVIENTGLTARVCEAQRASQEDPCRALLIDLVGILGRANVSGGGNLWNALYDEGISDAFDQCMGSVSSTLGAADKHTLQLNWEVKLREDGQIGPAAAPGVLERLFERFSSKTADELVPQGSGVLMSVFDVNPGDGAPKDVWQVRLFPGRMILVSGDDQLATGFDVRNARVHADTAGYSLRSLYLLWDGVLQKTATREDAKTHASVLDEPFLHFEAGTRVEDVWHWFEEQSPEFIVGDVMQGKRRRQAAA